MDSRCFGAGFEKRQVQKSERRELFPSPKNTTVSVPVSKENHDRISYAIAESKKRREDAEKKLKAMAALL